MLAARQHDPAQLAAAYRAIASLVLTIDGLQPEKGHETLLILSDFVVHSLRPPMEEAMSRLWSQLGWYSKPLRSWNGERRVGSSRRVRAP